MGMRQSYKSAFLPKISDIEAEQRQDLVDVTIVDEAETVELCQSAVWTYRFRDRLSNCEARRKLGRSSASAIFWLIFATRRMDRCSRSRFARRRLPASELEGGANIGNGSVGVLLW